MPLFRHEDLYNHVGVAKTRDIVISGPCTLSKHDKTGKVSLYKLFLAHCVDDPTEMTFAQEVFGDISFWLKMQEDKFVRDHVIEWRHHCDLIRKQRAFKTLVEEVKNDGKFAFSAAKYLIEEPWKTAPTARQRKAIKAEIEATADGAIKAADIEQDLERIKESYGKETYPN